MQLNYRDYIDTQMNSKLTALVNRSSINRRYRIHSEESEIDTSGRMACPHRRAHVINWRYQFPTVW